MIPDLNLQNLELSLTQVRISHKSKIEVFNSPDEFRHHKLMNEKFDPTCKNRAHSSSPIVRVILPRR